MARNHRPQVVEDYLRPVTSNFVRHYSTIESMRVRFVFTCRLDICSWRPIVRDLLLRYAQINQFVVPPLPIREERRVGLTAGDPLVQTMPAVMDDVLGPQ